MRGGGAGTGGGGGIAKPNRRKKSNEYITLLYTVYVPSIYLYVSIPGIYVYVYIVRSADPAVSKEGGVLSIATARPGGFRDARGRSN